MLGKSIDLEITCNPEEIVLKYIIKDDYTDNTLNKFSSLDEFNGIKRLNVFRFDEEQGMLLPVDTEFDVENNQLYAEVDETGTYCIMDMEIWLDNLGIETEPERTSPTPKPAPNRNQDNGSEWKPDYVNAPIDLVFILQTTGSDKSVFDLEKNLISAFSNYVFENNSDVNVYIITYDQYISKNRYSDLSRQKHQSAYEVASTLDKIKYNDFVFTYCDRSIAYNCLANDITIRESADVYVYHFVNGNTSAYYSSDDNKDLIQKVKNKQFKAYSEIVPNSWHYLDPSEHTVITNSINANNDLFIDIYHAPLSVLTNHFESKKSEKRPVYDIIVPTKWKKITLNGELSPENNIDTDGDTLTDWEEVDTSRLIWNADGSFEIPTFTISELIYNLTRFNNNKDYAFLTNDFTPRNYLPILSDPTMKNSDEDALNDDLDSEPLYHDPDPLSYSNILSVEIKYIPLQIVKTLTGTIGRKFAKKWDSDVYISILKSCDCDDDIFLLTNEDQSLNEVFVVSDELKRRLNNGEDEYTNSFTHIPNESAAHTGKLETDELVPDFFDKDSSYYYGCWYHNYCQEMAMYNYYAEQISTNWNRVMQAVIVYNIASAALQNAVLSSAKNTYNVSQEEYANTAVETKSHLSYIRVSETDTINLCGQQARIPKQSLSDMENAMNAIFEKEKLGTATSGELAEARTFKEIIDNDLGPVESFRNRVFDYN